MSAEADRDPPSDGPGGFQAELTAALPRRVEVGAGTALLIEGRCDFVDPGSLRVEFAGLGVAPDAEWMPAPGHRGRGDRWWLLLELAAGTAPGVHELHLRGRRGGAEVTAGLGRVEIARGPDERPAPLPVPQQASAGEPLVCVCMATWEPDRDRLAIQLDSLRSQTWPNWVCVISDDASSDAAFGAIEELVGDDARFIVSRSGERLGFYRNFERALALAPAEARWIALADQDDRWDRDKLGALAEPLGRDPVLLAFSDMRILDEHGELLSDTYWILRRNNFTDIASLLVANTVTGAASMFERRLLDDALPFPPAIGEPYHDHWLALCALGLGEIAYVDRPTYERTRHLESVTAGTRHAEALRAKRDGGPAPSRRRGIRDRLANGPGWRAVYFQRWLQLSQFARVLLRRGGSRVDPAKARTLRRVIAAEDSLAAAAWLGLRSLRPWFGRNETLARERVLLGSVIWRRLAGRSRPHAGGRR